MRIQVHYVEHGGRAGRAHTPVIKVRVNGSRYDYSVECNGRPLFSGWRSGAASRDLTVALAEERFGLERSQVQEVPHGV
jgi:hypothetical protein